MKLSIIVPCYNEEDNIKPLYNKVCEVLNNQVESFELIFVNDGSADRTQAVLEDLLHHADTPVKVITFSRNFGKESAIFAGLHEVNGQYICLMDGDLQQSPSLVLEMVRYLDAHDDCDCVTACQEERNENAIISFFKKSFYSIINKMSDTQFVNGASDFRTFRRNVADAVLNMSEYHRFSKGLFAWVGFNTHYIPYTADERLSGSSKWTVLKLFRYAFEGIMAFSTAPLRLPLFLGLGCITGSGLTALKGAAQGKSADPGQKRSSRLTGLILFMGGLQLTATGVLGEYLAKTYQEVKGRPVYIVRSVLSNEDDNNDGDNR